jgi:hypothetical protein
MSEKNTGILPDSDGLAAEAEQMKAHFAMLALRDMANHAVKHALEIRDVNPEVADYIDGFAATLRAKERAAALAAGVSAD